MFGAIVLLHHPTGFLVAPFAGFYVLWLAARARADRLWIVIRLSLGLALGLLLSAVFWLPALAELPYTQINLAQEGAFSVTANFINLPQLIRSGRAGRSLAAQFAGILQRRFAAGDRRADRAARAAAQETIIRRNL